MSLEYLINKNISCLLHESETIVDFHSAGWLVPEPILALPQFFEKATI